MEEKFFFRYHLQMPLQESMSMPVHERKWMIDKFIDQKNREKEAMDAERRKAKNRAK